MKKTQAVLAALLAISFATVTFAQDHPMSPKHRLHRQRDRVKEGVKDGSITPQEHAKLAREGHHINQERKRDLARDGGKLTPEDRAKLEHQENKRSAEVYQDKHN